MLKQSNYILLYDMLGSGVWRFISAPNSENNILIFFTVSFFGNYFLIYLMFNYL